MSSSIVLVHLKAASHKIVKVLSPIENLRFLALPDFSTTDLATSRKVIEFAQSHAEIFSGFRASEILLRPPSLRGFN